MRRWSSGFPKLWHFGGHSRSFCHFQDEYPTEIHAVGDLSPQGVDYQTAIVLKYPSGKIASLTTSLTADLPCEARVHGSEGAIKASLHWTHTAGSCSARHQSFCAAWAINGISRSFRSSWTNPSGAPLHWMSTIRRLSSLTPRLCFPASTRTAPD